MNILNNIAREIGQHKPATAIVRVERPACRQGFHEWSDVTMTTSENDKETGWQQCVWCGKIRE